MSKRWTTVQNELKEMTIEHRRMLVFLFIDKHFRLSPLMANALMQVVADLQPQAYVARRLGLHRQAVNRITRQFTAYLTYP